MLINILNIKRELLVEYTEMLNLVKKDIAQLVNIFLVKHSL